MLTLNDHLLTVGIAILLTIGSAIPLLIWPNGFGMILMFLVIVGELVLAFHCIIPLLANRIMRRNARQAAKYRGSK